MTDPTETTKTKTNWMTRFWKGFVGIALIRLETYLIGVVLAAAVIFAGGAFLFNRQEDANARQRASDTTEALDREYDTARTASARQVEAYENCLDDAERSVKVRDALRGEFIAAAVDLRTSVLAILPNSAEAQAAMDNYVALRQASVDAHYAPYVLKDLQAECQRPGPEPVDPTPEG